jgi:hypothetical protein
MNKIIEFDFFSEWKNSNVIKFTFFIFRIVWSKQFNEIAIFIMFLGIGGTISIKYKK